MDDLTALAEVLVSAAGAQRVSVLERDPANHCFRQIAASPRATAVSWPTAHPLIEQLGERRRPLVVQDPELTHGHGEHLVVGLEQDRDLVGLIVLTRDSWAPASHDEITGIARLCQIAVPALAARREAAELEARYRRLRAEHRSLATMTSIERSLTDVALQGGGLVRFARTVREITGKHVAIFGREHQVVADTAASSAEVAAIGRQLLRVEPGARGTLLPARPADGCAHRVLATAMVSDDSFLGTLAIIEDPSQFRALDEWVARHAAAQVRRELEWLGRLTSASWNARSAFTRQLIGGTSSSDDLRSSAEYLAVNIDCARILAFVTGPAARSGTVSDAGLGKELQRRLAVEVLATRGPEGVVLLIEVPAQESSRASVKLVKSVLQDTLEQLVPDAAVIVGVSAVSPPAALKRAYREAREVARCIERLAHGAAIHVLSTDDLGPVRLFVANSEQGALRGYVDDVLGCLLTDSQGDTLVTTLQKYFDSNASVRHTASALGVHENTVRLRLARVREMTGFDVLRDTRDQLSLHTAILVLRLAGHHPRADPPIDPWSRGWTALLNEPT